MQQLSDYDWIVGPFVLLLLSLPVAWIRARSRRQRSEEPTARFAGSRASDLTMLAILAFGYFATYLLLVSCTYFPFERYLVSMTLFIPSALVASLLEIWRLIIQPR